MDRSLDKPIVLIGSARSGTTLLGKMLSQHPDLCYINEPNVTWRYKNAKYWVDEFPVGLATDEVCKYINHAFSQHIMRNGGGRLLEKTPANSLRLPFVRKVLPNSKIIHVVRDGRDVAFSVFKKWNLQDTEDEGDLPLQVKKIMSIPLRDIPWYSSDFRDVLLEKMGKPRKYWGPRFVGIKDCHKFMSMLEICALQWRRCVDHVNNTKHLIAHNDYYEVRYEELIKEPETILKDICDFCELNQPENVETLANNINFPATNEWKTVLDAHHILLLENMLWEQLCRFNYIEGSSVSPFIV